MDDIPILKDMFDDGGGKYIRDVENFGDWMFNLSPPVYRFFVHRIPDFFRNIKWILQKIFRKHHCSDLDLWGLDSHLIKIILPKLIAFRKRDLHGYPCNFSQWDESLKDGGGMGLTREEYDKAKAEGHYVGGEMEGWKKTLDEMIFAFEYHLYSDEFGKKQKSFYEKYGYEDPHRQTEDNISWHYNYSTPDGGHMYSGELVDLTEENYKGYTLLGKSKSYYDMQTYKEIAQRAQNGFKLFGKYFQNLWD